MSNSKSNKKLAKLQVKLSDTITEIDAVTRKQHKLWAKHKRLLSEIKNVEAASMTGPASLREWDRRIL